MAIWPDEFRPLPCLLLLLSTSVAGFPLSVVDVDDTDGDRFGFVLVVEVSTLRGLAGTWAA